MNERGDGERAVERMRQIFGGLFRTVVPGLYPGRTRPVHVKVKTLGGRSLTTQLYIEGETQNGRDGILNQIPSAQRANVLIP